MKYLSVCSGIEAASVAWEPLGWEPVGFSEIEPFPAAVLKHHWPEVQNYGDMTNYEQWNLPSGSVDLLVGGTPCQSFSVAGLRKGLHDPRGGLMLTFLEIAKSLRPRWIVWENVPGVLSSNGGRDFGSFLGALGDLGYGWAYRVLDAQWFGVAQRRRRVFVVGCLGDGTAAAKVLFESESVRRDLAPSREKGEGIATDAQGGTGGSQIAGSLSARDSKGFDRGDMHQLSKLVPIPEKDVVGCLSDGAHMGGGLTARTPTPEESWPANTAETLMATDYKGPGHNRDHNFIPALYENHPNDSRVTGPHEVAPSCVSRFGTGGGNVPLVQNVIAVDAYNQTAGPIAPTIGAKASDINHTGGVINTKDRMAVRRLTPKECERLQGFPDDHTLISWRGKPADQCPDGPRYKALGNSMAVPCMAWIGKRIDAVNRENRKANK